MNYKVMVKYNNSKFQDIGIIESNLKTAVRVWNSILYNDDNMKAYRLEPVKKA
jgi:hypothetical protein